MLKFWQRVVRSKWTKLLAVACGSHRLWLGTAVAATLIVMALPSFAIDGTHTMPAAQGGGTIAYTNAASATEITNPDGTKDLLLKFTNSPDPASFVLPGASKARILAIGGGGGGGGAYSSGFSGYYGGGGGGGAGGFVACEATYGKSRFEVVVGKGGPGGALSTSHGTTDGEYTYEGKNGDPTTVTQEGQTPIIAYGGGGGGGESVGQTGGSGGGGSMYRKNAKQGAEKGGGTSKDTTQGNAGGLGDAGMFGGGGGGAGGAGKGVTESGNNPQGGAGKQSDITLPKNTDKKDWPWYAGGGGGGWSDNSKTTAPAGFEKGVLGGSGVGGNGGVGTAVAPGAGAAETGSGGGGCWAQTLGAVTGGAAGGSGVVYVRISMAMDGGVKKPDMFDLTYTGVEQLLVKHSVAYDIDVAGTILTTDYVATNAGTYTATVTLKKGFEWDEGGNDPVAFSRKILKAALAIRNLKQRGWMYGTPPEQTPAPTCTIEPDLPGVEVKYLYGDSATGPFSEEKPTEIGVHWIQASIAASPNWYGTSEVASFKIINGLGEKFIDYVEITNVVYSGAVPLTNFPFKVTLAEGDSIEPPKYHLPGFLYSRAGEDDGDSLAFTDEDGNVLDYVQRDEKDWNTRGESTLYVRVPELSKAPQVLRLYWCLRSGQTAPEHHPETVFDGWEYVDVTNKNASVGYDYDLVVRDGLRVNFWRQRPNVNPTQWKEGAMPGTVTPPIIADGTFTTNYLNTVSGQPESSMPTKAGAYRVSFELVDPSGEYEHPCECHKDFCILGENTYTDLKDGAPTLTLGGRVMLANSDTMVGNEVTDQCYWQTNEAASVYWEHQGKHKATSDFPNLVKYQGYNHYLRYRDANNQVKTLWRLTDILLGNTFNGENPGDGIYLPHSLSQQAISAPGADGNKNIESTWMVMRNRKSAAIYSPCYTNGIGTIYFDAINLQVPTFCKPEFSHIVVEVVTNVENAAGQSVPPTDENFDVFVKERDWKALSFWSLRRDNNEEHFTKSAKMATNVVLNIEQYGSVNNFFRLVVPFDYRGPARFRIRRATCDENGNMDADYLLYFLAIDNIIVSFPKSTVDLAPCGKVDPAKTGRQLVGQECAFNVPFPSLNDHAIYGRATNVVWVSAATNVNPKSLALLSRLHYRWRYLNQQVGDWAKPVDLSPFDDYRASEPLKVPLADGDVEFFFETFTGIPSYDYCDYSGSGLKLDGCYSEASGIVTNRYWMDTGDDTILPSGGKDWYFRYRAGKSDWSGINVHLTGAVSAEQPMELVGDHLWRGLVKVPTNAAGTSTFFFDGLGRYEEWGIKPVETKQWMAKRDIAELPGRGETTAGGALKSVAIDGAAGYLEFQFNDESGIFTVGHAEYQPFNAWHSAHRTNEVFVGNSVETSGVSQATMVQTNAHMNTWALFKATDSNWSETFDLGGQSYITPAYPKYTDDYLAQHKMPHQWNGANGLFVDAFLTASNQTAKAENSGLAWQMQGRSKGSISFTSSDVPSGIDTISYKARLAQAITFADISPCYDGDTLLLKNYTFACPAYMSKNVSTGDAVDYAPNASMSVFGYYFPGRGCYEFRVERRGNDGLQLGIYKWALKDGEIKAECLASRWFSAAIMEHNGSVSDGNADNYGTYGGGIIPKTWCLYLSLGEEGGGTAVLAGLSFNKGSSNGEFKGVTYRSLCVVDTTATRHTFGTFGLLPANCKGEYIAPRHYTSNLSTNIIANWIQPSAAETNAYPHWCGVTDNNANNDSNKISFVGDRKDDGGHLVDNKWVLTPERAQVSTNRMSNVASGNLYGLKAPDDLEQQVLVQLKSATSGDSWTTVASNRVSAYSFQSFSVPLHTNASCHVQFVPGSRPTDVTVHGIEQTAWNGQDISGIDGLWNDFIYTQARIDGVVKGTVTNHECTLQPARANPAKALSIRSPVLQGLGMLGFSYRNVKPGCRLLVQVATNDVRSNLSGTYGYNYSTNAVPLGAPASVPQWITVRTYEYDELKDANNQAHYLGWHTSAGAPLEGVMRLAVDPGVVRQAAATNDVEWGAVTVTEIYVHDEPALDARSWIGFNLRMIGDEKDSETRMFISDTSISKTDGNIGTGLSAGLNNSLNQVEGKDPSEYNKVNPCVQSPTFGTYVMTNGTVRQATIGRVRFRARLYETNSLTPATITLFGARDGSAMDWGDPLWTFTVTTNVYEIFEYTAPAQKSFASVRLAVNGVIQGESGLQRVLLDELVVSEKTDSSVGFVYARPFRTGLGTDSVVADILSQSQQPMAGESWGVQTQLRLDQLADDIDVDRGFRVTLRTFEGASPWGYDRWFEDSRATAEVELMQVGAKKDYVFRSTASDPATVVKPALSGNTVVQYAVTVYYYLRGSSTELSSVIGHSSVEGIEWTNPTWYEPVDYNVDRGGDYAHFSPYTILDEILPGRVWINELNWNDGDYYKTTNQFIEIAVPWGVDMKGWYLQMTDIQGRIVTLAEFGKDGLATVKKTTDGHRSGDYDFVVIVSPNTAANGHLKDSVTGQDIVPDATWRNTPMSSTFIGASLQYDTPYEFALYRPSGILEHQIVVGGTNELWGTEYEDYAYMYEGTNLVRELNEDYGYPSEKKRFFAGNDNAFKPGVAILSSFGVTTNCHGEAGGWTPVMKFTPGRVNEGQDELTGWYEKPHGGSLWVYTTVLGANLSQQVGKDTSRDTFVIVNSGGSTNITYTARPWYGIGALTVNDVTNTAATGRSTYVLNLNNITETTYVVAREGYSSMLIDAGLDPRDAYSPAIARWLANRTAAGTLANPEGPIVLGKFKGLVDTSLEEDLTLKDMYWLDMDPTLPGWWLRGGISDIEGTPIYRKRKMNDTWTEHYTNRQVTVKMYTTNDTEGGAPHKLTRLQGLGNEQSDVGSTYPDGIWTSETFKVTAMLNNGLQENFKPLRWFTFGPDSFDDNFESTIEVLDPFSLSSPGHSYGWYGWRGTSLFFRWSLDEAKPPVTVEILNKDSTYDGPPYEPDPH